jgi:simple sugar transport system permease protein
MQQEADVSIDVVRIIQAMILLFVAADAIVRWVFHLRRAPEQSNAFAEGWAAE